MDASVIVQHVRQRLMQRCTNLQRHQQWVLRDIDRLMGRYIDFDICHQFHIQSLRERRKIIGFRQRQRAKKDKEKSGYIGKLTDTTAVCGVYLFVQKSINFFTLFGLILS